MIFWRNRSQTMEKAALQSTTTIFTSPQTSGLAFTYTPAATKITASTWFENPMSLPSADRGLAAYLAQLVEEDIAQVCDACVVISWPALYRLLADQTHAGSVQLLGMPASLPLRPALGASGSLADQDFALYLKGWCTEQAAPVRDEVTIAGAISRWKGIAYLLEEPCWKLLNELTAFAARPEQERFKAAQLRSWGRLRGLALAAGAFLDHYLDATEVHTPEVLDISLRKAECGGTSVVELIPGFKGAPDAFLDTFDRYDRVQDRYDIPTKEGLAHLCIDSAAKTVLDEIKRLPRRRLGGERGDAFLRNPYALLGEEAQTVVSPERFEQARRDAGVEFYVFSHEVIRVDGRIDRVVLHIWPDCPDPTSGAIAHDLATPAQLEGFLDELGKKLAAEKLYCVFEGYELELRGDAADQYQQLQHTLNQWSGRTFTLHAAEILDLASYSARVSGVGSFRPVATPFIARQSASIGWVPDNIVMGISVKPVDKDSSIFVPLSRDRILELGKQAEAADLKGQPTMLLPEAPEVTLSTSEMKEAVGQLLRAIDQVRDGKTPSPEVPPGHAEKHDGATSTTKDKSSISREASVLLIRQNIEAIDYRESLGDILTKTKHGLLPPPRLPRSFKQNFPLKQHQRSGLAWLQALWSLTYPYGDPRESLRGCVLADDMGLGKTLQLLAFIHWLSLEKNTAGPCLVVAPVSLLQNWLEENEKFFEGNCLKVLSLYGKDITDRRAAIVDLDQELRAQKITKLLQPGWHENYDLILTNYETMRDYEFSLASIVFELVVCDEAQKIKTPGTLVTHAAKALKSRFKIACTGTPVENSLADLWCLFDFIQPGYLGSLSEFSKTYRRPIEARSEEDRVAIEKLRQFIEPFILRRMKTDVAKDLPPKIEDSDLTCQRLPLSNPQRVLYDEAIRCHAEKQRGETDLRKKGTAILGLLHRFRTICAAPCKAGFAIDLSREAEDLCSESPKLRWLIEALATIRERQEKAIVFTEFRDIQLYLQHAITERFNLKPAIVNGDDKAGPGALQGRQNKIDTFQASCGFNCIILSPKAVGFGMNIQAANHVIHYTRAWNPAVENQATDRAHRIGQERPVYVYCPTVVAPGFITFEETLDQLLRDKRTLAEDMLNGGVEIRIDEFVRDIGRPSPGTMSDETRPIDF